MKCGHWRRELNGGSLADVQVDRRAATPIHEHSFHLSLPQCEVLGVREPGSAPRTSLSPRSPELHQFSLQDSFICFERT